ncbi:hypothetical protein [uncultured Mediterranean phage uvMED]|nr:hypothetical protein [uncultured Mediterranean phage uvMED]
MPDTRLRRPLPALLGEFDASPYAGEVFNRTENGVFTVSSIPSTAGRYWDLIAFLNGYGSRNGQTMEDLAAATWGGAHPITFGIDSSDKFFVETKEDFTLSLQANDWSDLGFNRIDTRATSIVRAGVTYFRVTATNPWRRGVFQLASGMSVTRHAAQGDVMESILWELPRVQSLPTFLRERGAVGDADDVWSGNTLEDFDSQASARWIVEPDGRVTVNYYENSGFGFEPKGTDLWYRLGGDGLEAAVSAYGGRKNLTTRNPAHCVLVSRKGYVNLRRETQMRETRQMMTDGSIVSSGLPVLRGWRLTLRLDGPAQGAALDQETHVRRWWTHSRRTLTLYPSFGDADRPRHERDGCGGVDTRRHINYLEPRAWERYTLSHTAGAEDPDVIYYKRQGGRLLVRLNPTDEQSRREAYEESKDVHQDIDFILSDDPSR